MEVILVMVLLAEGRDVRPYVVSTVRTEKDVMEMKAVRCSAEGAFVELEVKKA